MRRLTTIRNNHLWSTRNNPTPGSWAPQGNTLERPLAKFRLGRLRSSHSKRVFRQLFSAFQPYGFASLVLSLSTEPRYPAADAVKWTCGHCQILVAHEA